MGERVVFEYIADDGERHSKSKMSCDFIPRILSFESCCGSYSHADDASGGVALKISKRARHRVRKTLDMFENLYDEIFGDDFEE